MSEGAAGPFRSGVRLTPAQMATFLDTLTATGNVRAASRAAGPSGTTFYNRRRIDPAFAAAWETARAVAYERVEAAARAQAVARLALTEEAPTVADGRAPGRGR
jgi:hypothetical protein